MDQNDNNGGSNPSPEETPRTKQRRELREKRIAYFGNQNTVQNEDPSNNDRTSQSVHGFNEDRIKACAMISQQLIGQSSAGNKSAISSDVRASMVKDTRVMSVDQWDFRRSISPVKNGTQSTADSNTSPEITLSAGPSDQEQENLAVRSTSPKRAKSPSIGRVSQDHFPKRTASPGMRHLLNAKASQRSVSPVSDFIVNGQASSFEEHADKKIQQPLVSKGKQPTPQGPRQSRKCNKELRKSSERKQKPTIAPKPNVTPGILKNKKESTNIKVDNEEFVQDGSDTVPKESTTVVAAACTEVTNGYYSLTGEPAREVRPNTSKVPQAESRVDVHSRKESADGEHRNVHSVPPQSPLEEVEHLNVCNKVVQDATNADSVTDISEIILSAAKDTDHSMVFSITGEEIREGQSGKNSKQPQKEQNNNKKNISPESLDSENLQNILGHDKYERLMQNLRESAWVLEDSDEEDADRSGLVQWSAQKDGDLEDNINELGLRTHRPGEEEEEDVEYLYGPNVRSADIMEQDTITADARNYIQLAKDNAKFAFSSQQIYEEAAHVRETRPESGENTHSRDFHNKDTGSSFCGVGWEQGTAVTDSLQLSATDVSVSQVVPAPPKGPPRGRAVISSPRKRLVAPQSENSTKPKSSTSQGHDKGDLDSSQRHVEGIRLHVEQRMASKESSSHGDAGRRADSPSGSHQSSLDRYFTSLEQLNQDPGTGNQFEPVPEPHIDDSPRTALHREGKSKVATSSGTKRKPTATVAERSGVTADQQLGNRENVEDDGDDCLTKVTSIVSASEAKVYSVVSASDAIDTETLTARLEKLGIDPGFLRDKLNDTEVLDRDALSRSKGQGQQQPEQGPSNRHEPKWSTSPRKTKSKKSQKAAAASFRDKMEEFMASEREESEKENEEKFSILKRRQVPTDSTSTLQIPDIQDEVRTSDNFEYSSTENPMISLPAPLKAELSLNLHDSQDSSVNNGRSGENASPQKKEKDLATLSESMDFEYKEIDSPAKSLTNALKAELSLNLRGSMESINSQVKQGAAETVQNAPVQSTSGASEGQKKVRTSTFKFSLGASGTGGSGTAEVTGSSPVPTSDKPSPPKSLNSPKVETQAEPNEEVAVRDQAVSVNMGDVHGATGSDEQGPSRESSQPIPINAMSGIRDDVPYNSPEARSNYSEFVRVLLADPRFRPNKPDRPQSAVNQSGPSRLRPKSGGRIRPQSASKVRASLEAEPYQRRWEKSSVAWGTYSNGDLRSSYGGWGQYRQPGRPSSAKVNNRESVGTWRHFDHKSPLKEVNGAGDAPARPHVDSSNRGRPTSAGPFRPKSATKDRPLAMLNKSHERPLAVASSKGQRGQGDGSGFFVVQPVTTAPAAPNKSLKGSVANTYAKYMAMSQQLRPSINFQLGRLLQRPVMSPRILEGELSIWLCLPDEILLLIMSYLSQQDLGRCAQVCSHFRRVAMDDTLWRSIVLKKNHKVCDIWLAEIGKRCPDSLSLLHCHGDKISANGLRELFRQCADNLKELNFSGCSKGQLTGDNILLHAASRCRNITHLDTSWCNINDSGICAIAESSHRLESLCMNGCQSITDDAIHTVVMKHGLYLRVLELFGCFNLTARGLVSISSYCKGLTTLNLGQCWKLTDTCITQLSANLTYVENLDLRGCKQIKDSCVHHIVRNCPHLTTLAFANCPHLTDVSLMEISTYCPNIRSLDVCGCKGMTNTGMRSLASSCQQLMFLDLSSTGINHKSVSMLASYCSRKLEVLKLNFCKHITLSSLVRVARNCRSLQKIYLYGVTGLRNLEQVRFENPRLWIEM